MNANIDVKKKTNKLISRKIRWKKMKRLAKKKVFQIEIKN